MGKGAEGEACKCTPDMDSYGQETSFGGGGGSIPCCCLRVPALHIMAKRRCEGCLDEPFCRTRYCHGNAAVVSTEAEGNGDAVSRSGGRGREVILAVTGLWPLGCGGMACFGAI